MLKEFDLDAPEESKENRHKFRMQTRNITALFERFFIFSNKSIKAWKILVEVVPQIKKENVRNLLGVLTVQVEGDIPNYFQLTPQEKKHQTLELLFAGIKKIAQYNNWNIEPFDQAKAAVVKNRYLNCWTWKAPLFNKINTVQAQVSVEHEVEEVTIYINFADALGNEIDKICIKKDIPSEFVFNEYLGTLKWVTENTVELISKDKKNKLAATCKLPK